ncbi:NACHT domain-containing protein [Lentzea flava]|uniref:NACHT domain-containing protein n=1 Tax=Lentzea flava TaxID=103732 RepID=A0ABQ2VE38_9PSEU|nr:NACHT domain-containing protein [Lentzea flava]MCP2200667.1 NACHT domain-containing protein [Lentzea flava]GGU77727.1 hypothetical protein GCM10010178_81040 [Lentzea flava]
MHSIESAVIRVVAEVNEQLAPWSAEKAEFRQAPAKTAATEDLLNYSSRDDVEALEVYLGSPDFATVVAQHRVAHIGGNAAKDQLNHGLRLAGLSDDLLGRATEVVYDVMVAASTPVSMQLNALSSTFIIEDLYSAAVSNGAMLKRLKSTARIHAFAARLRDQVVALHNRIRLPHVGVSRSVRYDQLYVEPTLTSSSDIELDTPGGRVVVLGDPGAGKSTLAAKFAHDIASDGSRRVPFLLVLREFTASFDAGGRDLLDYLEKLCQAPYNVKPVPDGVEYLLRSGRAVVILDGLDELVQTELRRRVVALVEGFAHLYPLVPILVTARKIGYEEAPLSTDLFTTSHIAEFSEHQVSDYATRWFELDEATSPAERERLAGSFLEDSEQIPELRSNPLLLALLCAMYSSDRYLPRNLAQVYERCALMLFEQWDSRRGIPLPMRFHGRLRGAVQHLAWRMLNTKESGKALSRTRIINVLTQYLDSKLDDHDESLAMAQEFLAFCTGRAWILSDVGATTSEPQFGFTHRTFLEYFAAEHLVRTHRNAADLWAVLRPNIGQWDVVAQIALQLYDRNVEGGVDELLSEAVNNDGLAFAARALQYVHPSTHMVRTIVTAAVDRSVLCDVEDRLEARDHLVEVDLPLHECMGNPPGVNRVLIGRIVVDRLGEHVERDELGAALLHPFLRSPETDVEGRLVDRYRERLATLWKSSPWAPSISLVLSGPGVLTEILERSGLRPLFRKYRFHNRLVNGVGVALLFGHPELDRPDLVAIAMSMVPLPWGTETEITDHLPGWVLDDEMPIDAVQMMLALPALEGTGTSRDRASEWLNQENIPLPVREFLVRWMRGEISVLAPDPEPRRRHLPPH